MDLLIVNHRDPRNPAAGGAEAVLLEVSRRLIKMGVNVTWLAERFPGSNKEEELDGILIKRVGNSATLHLYAPIEAAKHEVVIDSVAHAAPFFSPIVNSHSVALVHHVHQDVLGLELNWFMAGGLRWLERFVKVYPNIVSVSNTTKQELISKFGVKESKIRVIYNGLDHSLYFPGKKDNEPLILWIGRLKRYKNPIDAAKIYLRLRPEVRKRSKLVVIGRGELEEEVRREVINAGGEYLGYVTQDEKVKLYQRAWVVLSTSYIEGWGMTVVEANASGTPVVAYATGSLPEVIKQGINGYTVGYKDYIGAANKVEKIITMDENDREALFKSSYSESLKYDWEKTAGEYYDILRVI